MMFVNIINLSLYVLGSSVDAVMVEEIIARMDFF
jgi:hypothetical protein